ncbi:hypothetical protein Y695_03516 [Hydrogenophaga sp. T4]|nr:hypothetical protein Y695_03516 [Hydrogenophaga sp. T4]
MPGLSLSRRVTFSSTGTYWGLTTYSSKSKYTMPSWVPRTLPGATTDSTFRDDIDSGAGFWIDMPPWWVIVRRSVDCCTPAHPARTAMRVKGMRCLIMVDSC